MRKRLKQLILVTLVLAISVGVFARLTGYLVTYGSSSTTIERVGAVSPEFLVAIGRRQERTSIHDETPHRNSRLALFRREGDYYSKLGEDFPCRSETTNFTEPGQEELRGINPDRFPYPWGYQSVPYGVFTMQERTWKDGVNASYLLSDWGRYDGVMTLPEVQTIRYYEMSEEQMEGSPRFFVNEKLTRSSWEKRAAYLHPTITQVWSRGDSHGCINLHGYPTKGRESDWLRFISKLEKHGVRSHIEEAALLVVPFAVIGQGDELTGKLPVSVFDDALKGEYYER